MAKMRTEWIVAAEWAQQGGCPQRKECGTTATGFLCVTADDIMCAQDQGCCAVEADLERSDYAEQGPCGLAGGGNDMDRYVEGYDG